MNEPHSETKQFTRKMHFQGHSNFLTAIIAITIPKIAPQKTSEACSLLSVKLVMP